MRVEEKRNALSAWRKLLEEPEIRMDAEEQYDELLKMADAMEQEGLITAGEWRQLVREAGTRFAQATEGLGGGT
ncbi:MULTISPECIES: hypothetical protein [unclassified Pseudomonas]|uniref:hypothetical protein n=1 Tax=unclassified Pseudomonas TaxID=196821 RepID=UPI000A1F34BE|nr:MULTISPECIES: hypothetical protein [unclassified Pseudomonas]